MQQDDFFEPPIFDDGPNPQTQDFFSEPNIRMVDEAHVTGLDQGTNPHIETENEGVD
jgi:hypothetical protein